MSCLPIRFGAGLAKKGRVHERNQYFLWSVDSGVCDSPASPDAQESGNGRVPITKDVPVLRVDHISVRSSLLGVRHGQHPEAVSITVEK
jgi:hypothetical protein